MTMTSGTPWSLRRGLYGLLAGGLLSAAASTLIALPVARTPNAIRPWVIPSTRTYSGIPTCTSSCRPGPRPRAAAPTS